MFCPRSIIIILQRAEPTHVKTSIGNLQMTKALFEIEDDTLRLSLSLSTVRQLGEKEQLQLCKLQQHETARMCRARWYAEA